MESTTSEPDQIKHFKDEISHYLPEYVVFVQSILEKIMWVILGIVFVFQQFINYFPELNIDEVSRVYNIVNSYIMASVALYKTLDTKILDFIKSKTKKSLGDFLLELNKTDNNSTDDELQKQFVCKEMEKFILSDEKLKVYEKIKYGVDIKENSDILRQSIQNQILK